MATRVDVAIGVLVENRVSQRWVLITRRPDDVVLGGYWELPGGKLEPGEQPEHGLVREFLEEVGLNIEVGSALPIIEHQYDHGLVRLHPFYCRRLSGQPRNLAVEEHRWVRPEELRHYRFPAANADLIEEVIQALIKDDPTGS